MKIDSPSACERHVTVTIPREDIDRYFDKAFGELMPTAEVPGFRAGRAPRKLVEHRFRKEVADQVKGSLLMDSLAQISEDQKFAAISEPDFDSGSGRSARRRADDVRVRHRSAARVRPAEVEGPERSSGRCASSPRRTSTSSWSRCLSRYGQLVPYEGAAEAGDYVTVQHHVQGRRQM